MWTATRLAAATKTGMWNSSERQQLGERAWGSCAAHYRVVESAALDRSIYNNNNNVTLALAAHSKANFNCDSDCAAAEYNNTVYGRRQHYNKNQRRRFEFLLLLLL